MSQDRDARKTIYTQSGIFASGSAKVHADRDIIAGTGINVQSGDTTSLSVGELLAQLREQIESIPPSSHADKERLEQARKAVENEAARETPNTKFLNISVSGLVAAAEAVSQVAPKVLATAQMLARAISGT